MGHGLRLGVSPTWICTGNGDAVQEAKEGRLVHHCLCHCAEG
jgi:hypothetical protein